MRTDKTKIRLRIRSGWLGGAKVLGKLPVPGRPTIWIIVGQGPTALAAGAVGGCLGIFTLISPLSPLSPSLWETARYRLKYCLKGPLSPKQPTNQSHQISWPGFALLCFRFPSHSVEREKTDQTTRMRRLIRVFFVRTHTHTKILYM